MDSFELAFQNVNDTFEKTQLATIQRTLIQHTSTLYSSILDLSEQQKKGQINKLLTKDQEEYEDLKIIKLIGKGGFSEVYQAINENTKNEFALRLCQINQKTFSHARALKEIEIYNQLKLVEHPNIAKIFAAKIISSSSGDNIEELSLQVIMELGMCTLEDVFWKRVREKKPWTESELLKIFFMLVDALRVSRQYGISHRDLSLNNVILGGDLKDYKLIDFGEAKTMGDKVNEMPIVGKLAYLPPEIKEIVEKLHSEEIDEINYDPEKADVYSMGIMFGSLTILDKFDSRDTPEQLEVKLERLRDASPGIHSLVLEMINENPKKRKCFADLIKSIQALRPELQSIQFFELEFESGLQSKKKMASDGSSTLFGEDDPYMLEYKMRMKQGDFSMKNNLYGEAIINYVKVYEIFKRGEIQMNRE